MSIKLNDDVLNLITQTGKNINRYNQIISENSAKSLDRTYTGRIMSIGENNKCQVMYSNKSCWVEMADNSTHYINELVRVYVPNGDIDKAYCESISPAPCSKVIISKNQMVFQTTVSAPVFSVNEDGESIVEKTDVSIEKVIELTRDSQGRPVDAVFPDKNKITIEYKD